MSGLFISFEGGDGAGKSTLIEGVYAHLTLQAKPVVKTRAPGATEAGRVIRNLLLNQGTIPLVPKAELFLFLADRAEHVERVIAPALEKGQIVLCDRFNDSTIAYQGVGRDFGLERVSSLCHFASHDLEPTLTLYLDVDPKIGLARAKRENPIRDRIEAEALAFHEKIRATFLILSQMYPKRLKVIDAHQSKEQVLEEAKTLIDQCMGYNRL